MRLIELLDAIQDYDQIIGGISNADEVLTESDKIRDVTHVEHDYSKVNHEGLFVAIKGTSIDSHQFIEDARERGAALVIAQVGSGSTRQADINVDCSRAVLGPLANVLHGFPSRKMNIVGVTGTNGKTTCTYLYSSMVQAHKKHSFIMGTTGIFVDGEKESESQTTPDPLLIHQYLADFLDRGIIYGAMEVSSHALDQYRVLGTSFSAVGFTNITQDHLDYHKSMEEYLNAKMKLFSRVYSQNAVINIDDKHADTVCDIAKKNNMEIIRVSCKDKTAQVYVEPKKISLEGTLLSIHINSGSINKEYECNTPMIAEFNYENIALSLGLALASGLDMDICVGDLSNEQPIPGRLERIDNNVDFSTFVDYAHTPDALERVLGTLKPLCKKLIVVFGCGGDRDKAKRPLMGKIASQYGDEIIITNDNPRSEDPKLIAEEIESGIVGNTNVKTVLNRYEAIQIAIEKAATGDCVVVAGKGHERGQEFSDHTDDFSDVDVINEIFTKMV